LVGVFAGWVLASLRPAPAHARGGAISGLETTELRQVLALLRAGTRGGESIVTTGPVFIRYDEAAKAPIPLEAVYVLDYRAGRLFATIPIFRQTAKSTEIIEKFVERDLVADFKLEQAPEPGPHFLMTTGTLGPYTSGWAPLYVFETTTRQVGVYRLQFQQSSAKSSRPRFELVEVLSYGKAGPSDGIH
jgi:hypothetical protein